MIVTTATTIKAARLRRPSLAALLALVCISSRVVAASWAEDAAVQASQAPRSEQGQIAQVFKDQFSAPRDYQQSDRIRVAEAIANRLRRLGVNDTFLQTGLLQTRKHGAQNGTNVIGLIPGKHRHTDQDRILLLGAHWDSMPRAPGVVDNASGSVGLLELARLMQANKCQFDYTVMLVWFDHEELGCFGSTFFVHDYLFPKELERYKSTFVGAFVIDMILLREKAQETIFLDEGMFGEQAPVGDEIRAEGNRGDFLAVLARATWDEPLANALKRAWTDLGYEQRTLKPIYAPLPFHRLPTPSESYDFPVFKRSDHDSFWYPDRPDANFKRLATKSSRRRNNKKKKIPAHRQGRTTRSLNAVLLTDLAPWKTSYSQCYHAQCDDSHFLTPDNLAFMQQVLDSLMLTLMRLGRGRCNLAAS